MTVVLNDEFNTDERTNMKTAGASESANGAPKFKPGDRIVYLDFVFGRPRRGTVIRVSGAAAEVRPDDDDKENCTRLDHLHPETAKDVADRDHRAATKAWRERRPETKLAGVRTRGGWGADSDDETGAGIARARTPEDMRAAAAELLLLADWFAERPVKP